MAAERQAIIKPSADEGWWLYEYQRAMTNVRGLIARGQSEAATKLIDDLIARWQFGCQMSRSDRQEKNGLPDFVKWGC